MQLLPWSAYLTDMLPIVAYMILHVRVLVGQRFTSKTRPAASKVELWQRI